MSDHPQWCRDRFDNMRHGDLWVIPRSGAVYRRSNNMLLWVGTVPAREPIRGTAENLEAEFIETMRQFTNAGIAVWRTSILRNFDSENAAYVHYDCGSVATQ